MSSSIIQILDETTANKIAAGEVVEKPASVIKELVENAIDANSRNIEIEIVDGGSSFIRVTDDGRGMSHEDAKLAVLRHATSKIRAVEDLDSISSLGFRGEALPSIASVSKFTLTSRLHDETLAAYVEIHGGKLIDTREAGGNIGTTITVTDLFYNTPARRKFLKTPSTESTYIHDVVVKLALSHPEIAFKLINNNRLVLSTPGNGQLFDTLTSLYGTKIADDLLPIDYTAEEISISGFLGKPTLLRSSRQWQTILVNLRTVNSRFITKALDNAYHSLLPKTGYPLSVLSLSVPLETIDVNVHPQKNEIKFSDEQKVFRAVYKAVSETLTAPQSVNIIATRVEEKYFDRKTAANTPYDSHTASHFQATYSHSVPTPSRITWRETPLPLETARNVVQQATVIPLPVVNEPTVTEQTADDAVSAFVLQPLGQIENCYIIAQAADGLYIIDQHAAHERILYDRMRRTTERIPSQQILIPLFFEFNQTEADLLAEYQDTLYQLGFSLDLAGPNTFRLLELPSDIPVNEAESLIRQILDFMRNLHQPSPQDLRHSCLQMAACRAAIKAGEPLNMRQMQALLTELCATNLPYTCPHGRPATIRFSPEDLAKLFKRT